ncbi:MAG: acyl carrier protein [Alphaproteobacteria bacterium]|nr:acyl carrier protein [Alphaproteobacteria bacterium]MBQ6011898.1 acyl carrier protein [Alphaproteobacteria bacterium]
MYTKEEIFNTIKDILIKDFGCDEAKVKIESALVEDLDLDSIDAVDLIVKLQSKINQKVNPEDFRQIRTIGDVVDAVEKIVNNNH